MFLFLLRSIRPVTPARNLRSSITVYATHYALGASTLRFTSEELLTDWLENDAGAYSEIRIER